MGKLIYVNFNNFGGDFMNNITVFDVANTFLTFESMTHKKLQKLCYYAQAWFLALNRKQLYNEEIEAWVHGPVIPDLYQYYKTYGSNRIEKNNSAPMSIHSNDYIFNFIKVIYESYGHLDANELENLTHTEMPWKKARIGLDTWEAGFERISCEDMINYYSNL